MQKDNYENVPMPASVREAMKTYFINASYGSITALNEESKWRWDCLQSKIPETELVAFEITYKPYMSYDDAGEKEWRCSYYYLLCYSTLTQEQLSNRLSAYKYEMLAAKQPNWFIVIDDQQW